LGYSGREKKLKKSLICVGEVSQQTTGVERGRKENLTKKLDGSLPKKGEKRKKYFPTHGTQSAHKGDVRKKRGSMAKLSTIEPGT